MNYSVVCKDVNHSVFLVSYLRVVKPVLPKIIKDKYPIITISKHENGALAHISKEFINEPKQKSSVYDLKLSFETEADITSICDEILKICILELDKYIQENPPSFISVVPVHSTENCLLRLVDL
ncbi:MAG: hypothetical protein IPP42_17660 [Saprospiraceae bacterium]|nr:hypothetical protein [Saprospiraceae bacterium]